MKEKIYVCTFAIASYMMSDLEKMSDREKYDLAGMAKMLEDCDADLLTLQEFQDHLNDDSMNLNGYWVFFVEV